MRRTPWDREHGAKGRAALLAWVFLGLAGLATACGDPTSTAPSPSTGDPDAATGDTAGRDGGSPSPDGLDERDGADDGPWVAKLTWPTMPYAANESVVVDQQTRSAVTALAQQACAAQAQDPGPDEAGDQAARDRAARFLLGALPRALVDRLCEAPDPGASEGAWTGQEPAPDAPPDPVDLDLTHRLGALYVSGYLGGLWLRDALDHGEGGQVGPSGMGGDDESGGMGDPNSRFASLVDGARASLDWARNETDAHVIQGAYDGLGILLFLYGYNRGYLEVVLENPPAGRRAPEGVLTCTDFLACELDAPPLGVRTRFMPALDALADPPNEAWQRVADRVAAAGPGALARGRSTWEDILGDATLRPRDYPTLVDLSASYLAVAQAAVLGAAWAHGQADAPAGRCAKRVQAALNVWSQSYMLGLSSDAPSESFPSLRCEPASAP